MKFQPLNTKFKPKTEIIAPQLRLSTLIKTKTVLEKSRWKEMGKAKRERDRDYPQNNRVIIIAKRSCVETASTSSYSFMKHQGVKKK